MKDGKTYNIFNTYTSDDGRLPDKDKLEAIFDIGKQIWAMTDPKIIIENIIGMISRHLQFERCLIAKEESDQVIPIAHNIDGLPKRFSQWPISRSIVKRVIKTRESILGIDGQDGSEETLANTSIEAKGIKSFICTYLKIGDTENGIIYIDSKITKACFEDNDFFFLTALTSYIQLALENAGKLHSEKEKSQKYRLQYTQKIKQSIVGQSTGMISALSILEKVAVTNEPVLILGERGTGKELFAKAVHDLSPRASKSYTTLNVAAIPTDLIESEFFGYEPGSFTGALNKTKTGYITEAENGTLFLDEVGEMEVTMQTKLLRVLDGYGYNRIGGKKLFVPDVRFVFATNKDLNELKEKGLFKHDFYDRISIVKIRIPPLKERKGDIPLLVDFFKKSLGLTKTYTQSAISFLESLEWEGNVRQLQNLLKRIDVLCDAEEVTAQDIDNEMILDDDIARPVKPAAKRSGSLPTLKELEKEHIKIVLESTKNMTTGRVKAVSEILGVSAQTVHNKAKEYGLIIS